MPWVSACVGDLALDERGAHVAGAHGVAGDALAGGLERDHLRQPLEAVLGADVGRLVRRGAVAVDAGDVDEPAPAPRRTCRGAAGRASRNGASSISRWISAKRSGSNSSTGATCWMPALLTRMSASTVEARRWRRRRSGRGRGARRRSRPATSAAPSSSRSSTARGRRRSASRGGDGGADAAGAAGDEGGAVGQGTVTGVSCMAATLGRGHAVAPMCSGATHSGRSVWSSYPASSPAEPAHPQRQLHVERRAPGRASRRRAARPTRSSRWTTVLGCTCSRSAVVLGPAAGREPRLQGLQQAVPAAAS